MLQLQRNIFEKDPSFSRDCCGLQIMISLVTDLPQRVLFYSKIFFLLSLYKSFLITWKSLHMPNLPDAPRNTSVVISPSDPVSVGSLVNLTCSCRGNPPVVHFVWFMMSDGRLELIRDDTQVYGFKVTHSDRGRLFYCGCRNYLDIQLSTGHQLVFEGECRNYGLWCCSILEGDHALCYRWSTVSRGWHPSHSEDPCNHNAHQYAGHLWVVRFSKWQSAATDKLVKF